MFRHDGRIWGQAFEGCPADCLLFACGCLLQVGVTPIRVAVDRKQDRAAPRGTGDVKVGGNYAASLLSGEKGHDLGYSNIMYLDAAEHKYIEECGAANFFGIKEGKYITPKSPSVLPSITNMSLRQLGGDMGLDCRGTAYSVVEELATFRGVRACERLPLSPLSGLFTTCRPKRVLDIGEEGRQNLPGTLYPFAGYSVRPSRG